MKFTVLASGSKGNMTYIEAGNHKILIDAGISLVNAKKRRDDIDFSTIDKVFITHEHSDHIKFIDTVLKKTNADLYIHKKTFYKIDKKITEKFNQDKIRFIEEDGHYKIDDDFDFYTLKLSHDAAFCLGYIFKYNNKTLGYVTDTGYFPAQYIKVASSLDAIIIEANHNIEMLMESEREEFLKSRILSPLGHMSNYICFQVLKQITKGKINKIILAHISEECNSLSCIEEEILVPLKEIYQGEVLVASQYEATKMFEL